MTHKHFLIMAANPPVIITGLNKLHEDYIWVVNRATSDAQAGIKIEMIVYEATREVE